MTERMTEDEHCEVTNVFGHSCKRTPRFALSWGDGQTLLKHATVCRDCGHVWIDRLTREGFTVTVRPKMRTPLRA